MPCPFCGSLDIDPEGVAYYKDGDKKNGLSHDPACNDCGATCKDWNTRPQPSANVSEALNIVTQKLSAKYAHNTYINRYELETIRQALVHKEYCAKSMGEQSEQPSGDMPDEVWVENNPSGATKFISSIQQNRDDEIKYIRADLASQTQMDKVLLINGKPTGLDAAIIGMNNTNERVQELEARLEISPDHPYGGIETRNQTIKLQDKTIDDLQAKLKMATEALNDAKSELGNAFPTDEISITYGIIKDALQQIEGGNE